MPVETCGQNPTQNGDFRPLKRMMLPGNMVTMVMFRKML